MQSNWLNNEYFVDMILYNKLPYAINEVIVSGVIVSEILPVVSFPAGTHSPFFNQLQLAAGCSSLRIPPQTIVVLSIVNDAASFPLIISGYDIAFLQGVLWPFKRSTTLP